MKTNLSNRPEIIIKVTGHIKGIPREIWVNPEKAAIWLESFEEELREKLALLNMGNKRVTSIAADHEAFIIEEILGDSL